MIKHGYAKNGYKHPLYVTWTNIKRRCYKARSTSYKNYGARSIKVCDEWKNDPKIFIEWALINGYEQGLDIDRIDNDGNYTPSNCRFVTRQVNSVNIRKHKDNTSGYTGISKKRNKWNARIRFNKNINLGCYSSKKEALQKRNDFIIKNNLPHKIQKYIGE